MATLSRYCFELLGAFLVSPHSRKGNRNELQRFLRLLSTPLKAIICARCYIGGGGLSLCSSEKALRLIR
ncbi:hypothetical protein MTO96_022872 [Rhipicephalus appendiculatus]